MTAAPMLRELANVRQVAGEPRRRWFFCHEIDLVLFEDEQGICAFQLAYDKPRRERSLSWQRHGGFRHYLVDDGEPLAGANRTPLLYANGPVDHGAIIDTFLALAAELPPELKDFIVHKLREGAAAAVPEAPQ